MNEAIEDLPRHAVWAVGDPTVHGSQGPKAYRLVPLAIKSLECLKCTGESVVRDQPDASLQEVVI
jgi:hypothetical protein